jgi:hypothetical protein
VESRRVLRGGGDKRQRELRVEDRRLSRGIEFPFSIPPQGQRRRQFPTAWLFETGMNQ